MDKEQLKRLAKDPRFISGIYNYCDRWCERCPFTSACMNYALSEEESDSAESKDMNNQAFWGKLHNVFQVTLEMIQESAEEMSIDLNDIDDEGFARQEELVHKMVEDKPYTRDAFSYAEMVSEWFDSNDDALQSKGEELLAQAQAEIPASQPETDALKIKDCLEIIRWYQHQIYVKLCRAASGMIRGELEESDYLPKDANGSAKVAILGIERSIAAWGGLLHEFPDQENPILDVLVALKRLLRQVDAAFPDARAFVRPGFDTQEVPDAN